MNPNTGEVYRTPEEIEAAKQRGEPLVPVSERVADQLDDGRAMQALNRKQRARIRNRAARASRKRNRHA